MIEINLEALESDVEPSTIFGVMFQLEKICRPINFSKSVLPRVV